MKIPTCFLHYSDKDKKNLSAVAFDIRVTKIEDILEEFGGERKQSKIDTLISGLTACANQKIADKLAGHRFVVSRTQKPLYITQLDADFLMKMPLPKQLEDELQALGKPNTPAAPTNNSPFASVFNMGTPTANVDDKRKGTSAKELFKQLAGYFKSIHSDDRDDIFIFEVQKELCPSEITSSLLNSCEKLPDGKESMFLSFGLQKGIK